MKQIAFLAFIALVVPMHMSFAATHDALTDTIVAEIVSSIAAGKAHLAAVHESLPSQDEVEVQVVIDGVTVASVLTTSPLQALDICDTDAFFAEGFNESLYCYYGGEIFFEETY
jgi:predicted regulator of amino acid metabolism with ACT domain